jgi:hypothetical protein
MSIYQENGYENRKDYLLALSYDMNVDYETVTFIASMLGADEDFDGLVTTLEDYGYEYD